jgi:hypothetical protein
MAQGSSAKLQHPLAVATTRLGVLVADSYNHHISIL